jgi:hypothetical protein
MAGQSRTLKLSILGDIDQLKKSLDTGTKEVQGFGSKLGDFSKKAGLAFAAAGAAAAAYAGKLLIDGVKSAIADEAAQTKLATTLENVTGATNAQIKAVEEQILKTSLLTGRTDDELRPSLDRLLRSTKNVEQAQRLQAIALDISAGSGKSLEAVSNALAKSAEGQNTALGKLGVGISAAELKTMSFEQITAKLAGTFEGQASKQADTFQGKMARLTVAFDEAKETVGSYVLDALTPLISSFVDKGLPAVQKFADNLSKTLGPAFTAIFKVIKEDLLPILTSWWRFLYEEIIPAIGSIVGPILAGLKSAFDSIKKALQDNSAELQPFYDALKKVWNFIKEYLAPLLGGTFKLALQGIGTLVGGLVTGFSKLVGFISSTVTKIKEFVNFIKDNPVTRFFFGDSNDKSLKVGTGFDTGLTMDTGAGFGGTADAAAPNYDVGGGLIQSLGLYTPGVSRQFTLRQLKNMGITQEIANQLAAEDVIRNARMQAQIDARSSRPSINVTVNGAIDSEGTARTIVDTLNNSFFRGTGGATNLQTA